MASTIAALLGQLAPMGSGVIERSLASVGGQDFAAHLLGARDTSVGVSIDAGLDLGLNDDQMRRLAEAADRAQAAGASSALVMLDGKALRLDVASRRVTGSVSLAHGDVLTGIDAIVQASDPVGASGGVFGAAGSALGVHPSIMAALLK